jgi:glutathione S-transferase
VPVLDDRLARTAFVAGDAFSYGDIPVGIMALRYRDLVPDRPMLGDIKRWYPAIAARPGFQQHVRATPRTQSRGAPTKGRITCGGGCHPIFRNRECRSR